MAEENNVSERTRLLAGPSENGVTEEHRNLSLFRRVKQSMTGWSWREYLKLALACTITAGIVVAIVVFRVQDHIRDVLKYVEEHKDTGAAVYVAFYAICTWCFVSVNLLTMAGAFIFRPFWFTLPLALLGDALGAAGSFVVGRYLLKDWVQGQLARRPMFTALDAVMMDEGWKIVAMLRVSPLPFNLISYLCSATSISFSTFMWGTLGGVIPELVLSVWIGSVLGSLSAIEDSHLPRSVITILSMNGALILCAVVTLGVVGRCAYRKAMRTLEDHELDHQSAAQSNENGDTVKPIANAAIPTVPITREEEEMIERDIGGYTKVEKRILYAVLVTLLLDLAVCLPLYYHFRNMERRSHAL
ncbi:hypothetical protein BZG36_00630 [Bifiguratus adelaidae]|uniref:VTT domain-containing protein n=1 Tax=Bifiguratus adelaidae TaxID=1938954 RepID=A0A261Y7C9_9FUNG|nr:hypothetical protein BZG36_00630 [Bifiguratus adelaidae]